MNKTPNINKSYNTLIVYQIKQDGKVKKPINSFFFKYLFLKKRQILIILIIAKIFLSLYT